MTDRTELKSLAEAVIGLNKENSWPWEQTINEARLGKTTTAYALSACPAAILALIAENERLRDLLAEKVVNSTMLTGLIPEDGGMTVGFEGGACGMLAQLFGDQFYESKAINYLELRFDSAKHPELGSLVVTLQRVDGKTPHQLREVAETQVSAVAFLLKYLVDNEHNHEENQAERHMMVTETENLLAHLSGPIDAHTLVPDAELIRICGKARQ